jgi:hypothetical protein
MMPTMATVNNQRGSVIIITMIILVLLTIIGISAIDTSTTEMQIATNEQLHKIAFYAADGGTEAGIKLLEQNLIERDWADSAVVGDVALNGHSDNGLFYTNDSANTPDPIPSDTNRDAFLPTGYAAGQPHTNLKVRGSGTLAEGSASQLASGYDGKGKGAASGGVWLYYEIRSQHVGVRNSRSLVTVNWRYVP